MGDMMAGWSCWNLGWEVWVQTYLKEWPTRNFSKQYYHISKQRGDKKEKISLLGNSLIKHQTLIAHILRRSIANSAESLCVDVGSERVDPYTASLHPGVQICTSWWTVREGWWNASKNSAMNQQATHESINTSSFFRSAEGMEAVETGIYFGIFGYELESRNHFLGLVC